LILIIIVYPLVCVVGACISDPAAVSTGEMWLWPADITAADLEMVFSNDDIWMGYKDTITYSLVAEVVHLFSLFPRAYTLARPNIKFKKTILWFILFTMLFNGGMIPTYLVVKNLGMLDTMWAIVVPGALGAWSVLVAQAFYRQNVP